MGVNSGHRARVPIGRAASDAESSWGVASKGLSDGNASGLPPVPPTSPPSTPQLRPPPTNTAATGGWDPVCTAIGVNQPEHTRTPCTLQAMRWQATHLECCCDSGLTARTCATTRRDGTGPLHWDTGASLHVDTLTSLA